MPRNIRKPTGKTGAISLGPRSAKYLPTTFPETKEEIELFVARQFAAFRSPRHLFAFEILGSPTQNPTDDFDFTLSTSAGPKYLELLEVHLASIGEVWPTGQFAYEPYRAAELIFQHMNKKSERYRGFRR